MAWEESDPVLSPRLSRRLQIARSLAAKCLPLHLLHPPAHPSTRPITPLPTIIASLNTVATNVALTFYFIDSQ